MVPPASGRRERYDVVVCGGGAGGVAAAMGAARCGARVALLEQAPFLGGAATRSGVLTYCGFWTQSDPPQRIVGGPGGELLAALEELRGMRAPIHMTPSNAGIGLIEAEPVKLALDRACSAAGVEVVLHARLAAAETE